jgi:hypothetical protein
MRDYSRMPDVVFFMVSALCEHRESRSTIGFSRPVDKRVGLRGVSSSEKGGSTLFITAGFVMQQNPGSKGNPNGTTDSSVPGNDDPVRRSAHRWNVGLVMTGGDGR